MNDSSQPVVLTPWDLLLFRHQSCRYVEHLFQCEVSCIRDGMTIVQMILSHEYCWFHCYSHRNSPNHRMFLSIFCNIWNSFLSFSHLIIHPIHEWSWFYRQFWFCFVVSNDELPWPCFSLRVHNGCLRSIIVCPCWRGDNGLPRSIIHRFISFPRLRRPSFVISPTLSSVLSFQQIVCDGALTHDLRHVWQWVAPVYHFSQLSHSRDSDFHSCSSPGFLTPKMTELREPLQQGSLLASTSLWLFLPLNLVVLLPFLQSMSASWFLVSMYLIWILGSKLILSKKPIKCNSVGSGHMSRCGTSSLSNHLDNCFVVFKHIQTKLLDAKIGRLREESTLFTTLNIPWDRLFGPWLLSQFTTGRTILSWVWIVFPRTETNQIS